MSLILPALILIHMYFYCLHHDNVKSGISLADPTFFVKHFDMIFKIVESVVKIALFLNVFWKLAKNELFLMCARVQYEKTLTCTNCM
jgi:hypothetical protein